MFGLILMLVLGLLLLFLGWYIWKKEKINLIYKYHHTKISENNKKIYTEKIGKSYILIGIGMIVTGIINFITDTGYGWLIFVISFVIGFVIMFKAQQRYNGRLF